MALAHLARFETTEVGLRRVLDRAVGRWVRRAGAEADGDTGRDADGIAAAAARSRALIGEVVRKVASSGLVDDTRFAERRSALDARHGRSARASRAALQMKGVSGALAAAATDRSDEAEMAAALRLLRRRRLGPFGPSAADAGAVCDEAAGDEMDPDAVRARRRDDPRDAARRRPFATLARAGFGHEVTRRALALGRDEAERILEAFRDEPA